MQPAAVIERHALNSAIDRANAPSLLPALRQLHAVCLGMDLENQMERPTEDEYQAAMAAAAAALQVAVRP